MARALTAALVLLAIAAVSCGGSSEDVPVLGIDGDPLGLQVSPRDAQVVVETDRGAWVVPRGDPGRGAAKLRAELVAGSVSVPIARQLTVAFDRGTMLGSSHADDPRARVAADLGLLLSQDGGRTWRSNSLYGKADLHLLRPTGAGLWALDVARRCIAITADLGRTWACRRLPGAVTALAVDPRDRRHAVAATEHGLLETSDEARSWRPAAFGDAAAVVWAPDGTLVGVTRSGRLLRASRRDESGRTVGRLEGDTVAIASSDGRSLWALSRDGELRRSRDAGESWQLVARLR